MTSPLRFDFTKPIVHIQTADYVERLLILLSLAVISCTTQAAIIAVPPQAYSVSVLTDDFHMRHRVSPLEGITARKVWGDESHIDK